MDKISKTAGEILAARQSNTRISSTKLQSEVLSAKTLPDHWVAAIFKRMQARYGHKWTSAMSGIEETAIAEWAQILSGVTGEQIKHGLLSWGEDWPPSAPEFRKACLGEMKAKINDLGLNYTPPYHAYVGRAERRQSHLLSSGDRDARRAKAREGIAAMREALSGVKHG